MEEKGITNEQLRELGIADDIRGITRNEAKEILVLANSRGNQGTPRRRKENGGDNEGVEEKAQSEEIDGRTLFLVSTPEEVFADPLGTHVHWAQTTNSPNDQTTNPPNDQQ